MKRIGRAYETEDGQIFKTKREAKKHEFMIAKSRLATKWFHGYIGDLVTAVRGSEEFLADFIAFSREAKEQDPMAYANKKDEEEEIPF